MRRIVKMQQVHGNNVVFVGTKDSGKTIFECDGLVTNSADVTLRMSVADCLPIFISDVANGSIGVVHAGWRGLENKIIEKAIMLMCKKLESNTSSLCVYVGPHICQKHYEVKSDVSCKFERYPRALTVKDTVLHGSRTFLDLAEVAKQQLIDLGIKAKNIKIDKECTFENKKLKSYRRGDTLGRSVYLFSMNINYL